MTKFAIEDLPYQVFKHILILKAAETSNYPQYSPNALKCGKVPLSVF